MVGIVTDTNSGFTEKQAKQAGIYLQPMPFYVDGNLKYEGRDFSQNDFYKALEKDCEVSTSMPVVGDVMDLWDMLLNEYDELIYIPMSSALSSSCETARMISEDYGGRVRVVDNKRIAMTMKLSAYEAKVMADKGRSAAQICEYLEERGQSDTSIYIMVDTLKYLKKGGRLTPAVAAIGTILRIKPVLQIQGGKLDTFAKARTLKQSKQIMIEAIKNDINERFNDPKAENIVISVAHTNNKKEAEIFRDELISIFPNRQIIIDPLALSVACHIGPGSLAVSLAKSFLKEMN